MHAPRYPYLIYSVLLVFVYLLVFILFSSSRKSALEHIAIDAAYNAIVLANDISKILEKSEMILDLLELEVALPGDKEDLDIHSIIKDFRIKYLNIYDLYIFDSSCSNYNAQPGNPVLENDLKNIFNYHRDNLIRSQITVDPDNTGGFWVSRAVFDSENRIENVYICSVNIEKIISFDEIRTMYNFSDIAILDKNQQVLFSGANEEDLNEGHVPLPADQPDRSIYKITGYPFFIALETESDSILKPLKKQYLLYLTLLSLLFLPGFFLVHFLVRQNRKQVELEEKLAQQSKLEAIGRVTGGVAHEFNNIHAAIMGASELLKTSGDSESKERYLGIIIKSLNKATGIIEDLLSYSRKNFILLKEDLNILEIISGALESVREDTGKDVEAQILNHEKVLLKADRHLLYDALYNLIHNAFQAVRPGGTVSIDYRIRRGEEIEYGEDKSDLRPDYVEISVADKGHGIAEEYLDKIFDPFFSTKEQGSGIGLGLSSVYGIVREHNGLIDVYSRIGEGTTIRLAFPLAG